MVQPDGSTMCAGSEVMYRVTTRLFTKQRKSVTKVQRFRKQEYSKIGNNNTAFLVTRVYHWIPEQVRSVAVHLKVIQAVHLKVLRESRSGWG